jgi:hypothetical protein
VLGEPYHLSALFGTVFTPGLAEGGSLELWAGGTVADGNVTGGTLVGTINVNNTDLVLGEFLPFQTDFTAPSSGPLGGALLSIRFVSNGRESEIDNIQLSTPGPSAVPEPASLSLLTLGVAGLAGYGWRKRRQG